MTMYDKLGALLSEALETGELPKFSEDSPKVEFFSISKEKKNQNKYENSSDTNIKFQKESEFTSKSKNQKYSNSSQIFYSQKNQDDECIPKSKIRIISPLIKSALNFIGISETATFEEAKKVYREKLMYYHPDRRNDNPVLQKVAKEKTERLLREWAVIEKWYAEEFF